MPVVPVKDGAVSPVLPVPDAPVFPAVPEKDGAVSPVVPAVPENELETVPFGMNLWVCDKLIVYLATLWSYQEQECILSYSSTLILSLSHSLPFLLPDIIHQAEVLPDISFVVSSLLPLFPVNVDDTVPEGVKLWLWLATVPLGVKLCVCEGPVWLCEETVPLGVKLWLCEGILLTVNVTVAAPPVAPLE